MLALLPSVGKMHIDSNQDLEMPQEIPLQALIREIHKQTASTKFP